MLNIQLLSFKYVKLAKPKFINKLNYLQYNPVTLKKLWKESPVTLKKLWNESSFLHIWTRI